MLTEQGHPEDGTDDEAPNQSETFVIMKPGEASGRPGRTQGADRRGHARAAGARPGVDYNFSQPIKDRVEESISGIRGQVVVKIYGDDLAPHAREAGARSKRSSSATRGRARRRHLPRGQRAAHRRRRRSRGDLALRRLGARRRGRARERVRRQAGDLRIWEGERRVGVRVKLPTPTEGDPASVGRLEIPTGARARCRSRRWPSVHVDSGRTQINREQGQRFLALKCNIEGRDMGQLRRRGAGARGRRPCKLPEGYHLTWGGEFENQRRAMKRLASSCPISVLVIFFLLYLTFRAALPALVVLLDVPFATVGGVFALYLTRHRALGLGGGRVHHAVRRGGHGRRAARHLHAPGAREHRPTTPGGHPRRGRRSACARC